MARFPKPGAMGKGATSMLLPSRHALNTLTKGDPAQRTLGMYGKATPADVSGVGQMSMGSPVEGVPPTEDAPSSWKKNL
jgi:hypothetical protein